MARPARTFRSRLPSRKESRAAACRALRRAASEYPSLGSRKRSSRGEKHDATGRAAVLGPAEGDLPGAGGDRPRREGSPRRRGAPGGPLTARARRRLMRIGIGRGVVLGMLLQQSQEDLLAQFEGALFALIEGDEPLGEGLVEHQVKSSPGLLKEALPEDLAAVGGRVVHDVNSKRCGQPRELHRSYPYEPGAATGLHPPAALL